MARVFCTKKLKDFIGNVAETLPEDHPNIKSSDWNAHLFFFERKKCIVFVNIFTYYSIFITDIVKKDLKNIDAIFERRLKEQLLHDGVANNNQMFTFFMGEPEINFFKTNNNKKVIGRINDFVNSFKIYVLYKDGSLDKTDLVHENGLLNSTLTGKYTDKIKRWTTPLDNIKEIINTSS
jgi:hypothetical protein